MEGPKNKKTYSVLGKVINMICVDKLEWLLFSKYISLRKTLLLRKDDDKIKKIRVDIHEFIHLNNFLFIIV